jgi:thiol-disulfide isomerase/thioredoxin
MKSIYFTFLLVSFNLSLALCQNSEHVGLKVDKVIIKQGEEVVFTLNTSELDSKSDETVFAVIMPFIKGQLKLNEVKMTLKDKLSQLRYTVPNDADALAIKFLQGKNTYINNEKGYFYQVFKSDGSEITNSYFSLYSIYQGNYTVGLYNGDKQKADEYYEKWEKNTDLNKLDFMSLANHYNKQSDSLKLSNHVKTLAQQANLSGDDFNRLFQLNRNLTSDAKATLEGEYNKRFPIENEHKKINTTIRNEKDFESKFKLAQEFQNSLFKKNTFFDKTYDAIIGHLGNTAHKNINLAQMIKVNELSPKNVGYENTLIYYNRVFLNTCYSKDTLIQESKQLLDATLDMASKMQPNEKTLGEYHTVQTKWQEIKTIQVICDGILSEYYSKSNQPKLALPLAVKTAQHFDWSSIKFNHHLISVMEAAKEEDKYMDYVKNIFVGGGFDEKLIERFKTKNKDAATYLDTYRSERIANLKKKIKAKMLNIPIADFKLTDGTTILKKSDLQGNVLFMDFWATWCRPCIASFPAMQKFSDANKKNVDYKMFFVNTYQGKDDPKKEVANFLIKNPFTFHVVYDLDDSAAKSLGVTGLPTKMIVDRNGIIRYISIGTGDNENKAVEELQAMMELADEASATPQKKKARIKGKLIGFQSLEKVEDFSEFQYLKPTSPDRMIHADTAGLFSVTFEIDEPNYFRIGRNVLYISPGDDLDATLELANGANGIFKGIGAEANNYLRETPFPKGGSYLNAGRAITTNIYETLKNINEEMDRRINDLQQLTNVSEEFKRLEHMRIKADVFNTLDKLQGYSYLLDKKMSKDSLQDYRNVFLQIYNLLIPTLKQDFIDASLLKLTVYRDIAYALIKDLPESNVEASKIREWQKTSMISSKLERGVTNDQLEEIKKSIDSLTLIPYKNALYDKIEIKSEFKSGSVATDFTAEDMNGKLVNLSSLKGKTIYVDLWATWCGPCMAEMPHLKTLKEEFKKDKNIAIVSLSIDNTNDPWLKYLKSNYSEGFQWRINRLKLEAYSIVSVPRYLIIDKQFNVHSLNAPPPSDPKLKNLLKSI